MVIATLLYLSSLWNSNYSMKDIVNQILLTEKRVEEVVQKAKEKAQEIKQQAESNASKKVEVARKKTGQIISAAVENAKSSAQKLRTEKLRKAEEDGEAIAGRNKQKIDKLVQDVIKLIIHTEYAGEGI